MCGIAGAVEPIGARPAPETLTAMGQALAHRGPDDARVESYGRAGFAFRRLAIVDLAGGAQPLANEDGTCHVILNGEIYNHLELRVELEAHGHRFRTRSDVEVVVHGYEQWGDAVAERLRGMFAFAVWDALRQRLLLARDRLGEKPLVYWHSGARLYFASELQALVATGLVPREAETGAIHDYLTWGYVPPPRSAFRNVYKLPPAHVLSFENGELRLRRYWTLRAQPTLQLALPEAGAELRRRLREAVRLRLMSDVPLGAFLSGGIDSSAVVGLMAEFGRVQTFSIGFADGRFDERTHARSVAQHFATDHREFVVEPRAAEVLPKLVEHYGDLYADSSALPTYYLAQLTRRHVTVALSGDGGDELFAGYERYRLLRAYRLFAAVPGAYRLARAATGVASTRFPRVARFLAAVSKRPEESYARTISYFSPEAKQALYHPEMCARTAGLDSFEPLYTLYSASDAPDLLGRTLQVDALAYLPEDLLVKVDIATMSSSLESRAPFLDHPLVEFAARLPTALKRRGFASKRVLRRAVADLLPASILRRRKQGFGVPVDRWFRGELRPMLHELLLSRRARERGVFEPSAVERLLHEHDRGRDHGQRLWALLSLELWFRRFVDTPPAGG